MTDSTEKQQLPHLFKPGQSGNPAGRPKGSRQKLQTKFLDVLAADFDKNGADAVIAMRENDPSGYVKAIASLMPKQLEIERPLQDMTDDDLIAGIAALQRLIAGQGADGGVAGEAGSKQAKGLPPLH